VGFSFSPPAFPCTAERTASSIFLLCCPTVSCTLSTLVNLDTSGSESESLAFFIKKRIEISMPEAPKPALEAETIRRMASEELMLSLTQTEVEALHSLLNSLVEEIRQISPRDRSGAEPEMGVVVQEWPA
jgi:hypothetical protein